MAEHDKMDQNTNIQAGEKKPGAFARLMQKLHESDETAEEKARYRRMFAERMDKGF